MDVFSRFKLYVDTVLKACSQKTIFVVVGAFSVGSIQTCQGFSPHFVKRKTLQ